MSSLDVALQSLAEAQRRKQSLAPSGVEPGTFDPLQIQQSAVPEIDDGTMRILNSMRTPDELTQLGIKGKAGEGLTESPDETLLEGFMANLRDAPIARARDALGLGNIEAAVDKTNEVSSRETPYWWEVWKK